MRRRGYKRRRYHKPRRQFRRRYSLFQKMSYFSRKHPIAIGVLLIVGAVVLFRLSFTNAFLNSSEVLMWSIIASIGLFIAGLLVLKGYWKRTVPDVHGKGTVEWRNR